MSKLQYSALALVVLVGLLLLSKAAHESMLAEEARRAARNRAIAEKVIDTVVKRKVEYAADIQACIDKGGVPIKTLFTGRLKRCDFPVK